MQVGHTGLYSISISDCTSLFIIIRQIGMITVCTRTTHFLERTCFNIMPVHLDLFSMYYCVELKIHISTAHPKFALTSSNRMGDLQPVCRVDTSPPIYLGSDPRARITQLDIQLYIDASHIVSSYIDTVLLYSFRLLSTIQLGSGWYLWYPLSDIKQLTVFSALDRCSEFEMIPPSVMRFCIL